MKLETIKSLILTILVGVSLLLTLGLWNYQPRSEFLGDMNLYDVDIGGKELTKKEIVEPRSIIFHNYNRYYGFSEPSGRQALYHDMQSWVLYNFKISESSGPPKDDRQVELIFPDALPMEIVRDLFTLNGDTYMPDWTFKRMFITFDENNTSLKLKFLDVYGDKQATAMVNNVEKYEQLWNYTTTQKDLTEYLLFDKAKSPIYLPEESNEMNRQAVTINTINPNKLVSALFPDKSLVNSNISSVGETYFFDGQRGMRVKNGGHLIRFTNPLNTNYTRMEPAELINISLKDINQYKGWTGDYNLEELQKSTNYIRYRMYYAGYPVFNSNDLSIIEQEWRNLDLYQYNRPLLSLNSLPGGEHFEMHSGNEVISLLKNSSLNLEEITDIKIGFRMIYQNSASYYVTLEPAWYMNYNGDWRQIMFDDLTREKGGS